MKGFFPLVVISTLLINFGCKKKSDVGGPVTSNALEVVYQDSTYQLTGVAISKDGRLFTCYPLWSNTYKNAVAEITHGNPETPYPSQLMNSWVVGDSGMNKWVCAQAVYIDANNNLWVVDPASPYQRGVYENSQKLVEINLGTNTIMRTYPLTGVTDDQAYLNDVRVDVANNIAYITNSSEGGIVVVNLNTGAARQVLQGSSSVIADQTYILTIDGQQINKNGAPFYGNSDGLALAPDNSYLYYKPLTDHNLYRIPTADLQDTTLSPTVLSARVENLGTYVATDGMIMDQNGNLYLGDLEQHRIVKLDKNLKLTTVVQDSRLIWPDSYSISTDGYLYISCSQINLQPDFNNGANKRTTPYTIYKVKLP
jgi:sugar lactone lactonase YvrE